MDNDADNAGHFSPRKTAICRQSNTRLTITSNAIIHWMSAIKFLISIAYDQTT